MGVMPSAELTAHNVGILLASLWAFLEANDDPVVPSETHKEFPSAQIKIGVIPSAFEVPNNVGTLFPSLEALIDIFIYYPNN
jgi:hypothetical protein